MKRNFAILALILLAVAAAHAQKEPCAVAGNNNDFLGIQTIRLWPGEAPEAKGKACEDIPTLTVFAPRAGQANGSAVMVLPGGAYVRLAADHEGRQVADWFTARGFRAFVLSYRLSSNGYMLPVPLIDARRAVQTVRARARDYAINPNRIAVIGFSAGGHLAALSATQFVPGNPDADDPIERVSSRPDFLVLGYPWIGAISGTGIAGINATMALLAERISPILERPVIDRTGIEGSFDFRFRYPGDEPNPNIGSVILTSVQGLGLKLEPSRAPVKILLIDRVEHPSAN